MKKQLLTYLTTLCCGAYASMVLATSPHESMDQIIATINDTIITQSELDHAIDTIKKQMTASQTSLPSDADLHKQVLDQLINRKLQLQLAEQSGVQTNEDEIDHAIKQIAQQNKIQPEDIYQKISEQGMSKSDYRKEIQEEITLQKIQGQEVASKITVSPQEIDDFMRSKAWLASNNKEYHLEDILIGLPDEPTSEQIVQAKKEANTILDKIHHGMNFNQAAMADSTNAAALKGGDLGWRKLPEIPTAFANQILTMKPGDVKGPIQAQNGFHIIKLTDTRDTANKVTASAQRKQVEQLIFQRKIEEGLQNWLVKLHSTASINLTPDKDTMA